MARLEKNWALLMVRPCHPVQNGAKLFGCAPAGSMAWGFALNAGQEGYARCAVLPVAVAEVTGPSGLHCCGAWFAVVAIECCKIRRRQIHRTVMARSRGPSRPLRSLPVRGLLLSGSLLQGLCAATLLWLGLTAFAGLGGEREDEQGDGEQTAHAPGPADMAALGWHSNSPACCYALGVAEHGRFVTLSPLIRHGSVGGLAGKAWSHGPGKCLDIS